MEAWKQDFIEGLKAGKSADFLARSTAGLPLAAVQAYRDEDPEFNMLWDEAARFAHRLRAIDMTPASLEKAMSSMLPDKEVAAFFHLSVEEFLDRVDADADLAAVYNYARDAAKVRLGMAQFETAVSGHADMQKWVGKQHLGQGEQGTDRESAGINITFNMGDPSESYRRLIDGGTITIGQDGAASITTPKPDKAIDGD